MDLPLHLSDSDRAATVVRLDAVGPDLPWWFWIKAGIGFTLGASTIGVFLVMLSWVLAAGALGAFLSILRH